MSFALWRDRLLLLLLALLPWQARYIKEAAALFGVPWEQGTAALFVLDVLLLAAITCHLLDVAVSCEPRKRGAPMWLELAALIPVYAFISVFWAYDTTGALFSLIRLCEGYALAYLLWVSKMPLVSALRAFVFGATVSAAVGLWQFFTQTSFASAWLGVSAHPAGEAGVAVIENASGRFLRAYGTLPHPNVLGGYAAAGLIAVSALSMHARRFRAPLFVSALLLGAGLAASFSRSAWLAAACAFATALLFPRATGTAEARRHVAPALLATLGGAVVVAFFAWPMLSTRLSFDGRLEARSVAERAVAATGGTEMLLRYFATGVGVGNYLPTAFLSLGVPEDVYAMQPPHFVPLLLGAELGFFGLAILLGFVFAWWYAALWLLRRTPSALVAVTATLPLVILLVSCFDHYPYDIFAGTMLTGACFGFFLKAGEEEVS
jgi:hypothetical protein